MASGVLTGVTLPGGALYLLFSVTGTAVFLFRRPGFRRLPGRLRAVGGVLVALTALAALALLAAYPPAADAGRLWLVFALVLLLHLRALALRRLHAYGRNRGLSGVQTVLRLTELSFLFVLPVVAVLIAALPLDTAFYLAGGYALTALAEVWALPGLPPGGEREVPEPPKALPLREVRAYRAFALLSAATAAALQATVIMLFAYQASDAGELLLSLGLVLVSAALALGIGERLPGHGPRPGRDPANVLLLGLSVWLLGLTAFALHRTRGGGFWAYASLSACAAGSALGLNALGALHAQMPAVLAFANGSSPEVDRDSVLETLWDYASLIGRVLALGGLSFLMARGSAAGLLKLRPAPLLPAGVLVTAALLAAFRFPLEKRYTDKLRFFLMLRENGETNAPLQKQLEDVILKVKRRRYGIKLLVAALRPVFRTRVQHAGEVRLEEGVSAIFACNHGELYGPIVAYLYIPFPFRPWAINETVEKRKVADYIYTNTFQWRTWIPRPLRRPVADLLAPALAWIMDSVESIPVHRDNPRALIATFRDTCAAMEAGDNILLFPENPNDPSQENRGYLREGIGPFHTGFVMAARLYHQRTGKCARFVPVYADKHRKTLSFGRWTDYDPLRPDAEEKRRVAEHLRGEMLRLAGGQDA